ncbi:GTP-binding protein [Candidatus Woesearchaeota archaeon]|nr:MAG: GTP-binding protein [Candidatus Woesearchaeota archaeon]
MNLHDLEKVESPSFYLDLALRKARERAANLGTLKGDKLQKARILALTKLTTVQATIASTLRRLVRSFPSFDDLPEFYQELCKTSFSLNDAKKALATLEWVASQAQRFGREYARKIKTARTVRDVHAHRAAFYGRSASLLKQAKNALRFLEAVRKELKTFPAVKTSIPTVCIAGLPNAGKSTLLAKLTTAKPKIAGYAFTTTQLNLGYARKGPLKLQFIDTPGTLARPEKMNRVERQAHLALKYLADLIVFVVDPSGQVDKGRQKKLFTQLKRLDKPIILYASKADLVGEDAARMALDELTRAALPRATRPQELLQLVVTALKEA